MTVQRRLLVILGVLAGTAVPVHSQQQYVVGEQGTGKVYLLADLNGDGDCLDAGEKVLWASGLAEVSDLRRFGGGVLASDRTSSAIRLLRDLNGDGDALDADENIVWAAGIPSVFGLAVGPGMAVFAAGYTSNCLWRLVDLNGDGDCLDAGEMTLYAQNLAGPVGVLATHQGLFAAGFTGGYVSKLVDLDGDGDCLEAGEVLSYSPSVVGAASGLLAGRGGVVFASSRSNQAVYRLQDLTGDGDALDTGETLVYADSVYGGLRQAWSMAPHATGGFLLGQYDLGRVSLVRDLNGDGDALDLGEVLTYADGLGLPTGLEALRGPGGGMLTIIKNPGTLDPATPSFYATVDGSTVGRTVIGAALDAGQNVIVSTDNPFGFEVGGIVQESNATIYKTQGADVTIRLQADDSIRLEAGMIASAGRLNVKLTANDPALAYRDHDPGAGDVRVLGPILTNGGWFLAGGASFLNDGAGDVRTGGGDINVAVASTIHLYKDLVAGDGNLSVAAPGGIAIFGGRLGGRGAVASNVACQPGTLHVPSGVLILSGFLSAYPTAVKTGAGTLELTGAQYYGWSTSTIRVEGGTVKYALTSGGSQVQHAVGAKIVVLPGATVTAAGAVDPFTDGLDANKHLAIQNDGLFRMISGSYVAGPVRPLDANLLLGTTQLDAGSALSVPLVRQGAVIVGAGARLTLRGGSRTTSDVKTLTIAGTTDAWTGQVDVRQNYLIVREGNLATIENQIQCGMNLAAGYWDGNGITSSLAAADTEFFTAVGVLDNALAGFAEFGDANNLVGTEILVRYTFYGDADLSGTVDFDNDYILWQEGFLNGYTGWVYGDFNHDGVVDFDNDYILWQTVFLNQPTLPGGAAEGGAGAGVPEPSAIAVLALGAALLLLRRRRR